MVLRIYILSFMIILGGSKANLVFAAGSSAKATILSQDARLAQFFEDIFQRNIANSPDRQTSLGLKTERQGLWTDISDDYSKARTEEVKQDLARLEAEFDYAKLSPDSQLSYDIFKFKLQQAIENARFLRHLYVLDQFQGQFTYSLTLLQNNHKIDSVQDAQDYISRIIGIEDRLAEMVKQSQDRANYGVIAPQFAFPAMIADIQSIIEQVPIKADFADKVAALNISAAEKKGLIDNANKAIEGPFKRGYIALLNEVKRLAKLQKATQGVWALPEGEAFYQNRIKNYTNLDMTADQIHEFGKADVARIHAEMRQIMQKVGFKGSLQAFFEFVRTDPNNFYPNSEAGQEAFLADARAQTAAIFKVAPKFFNKLPKAELEVRKVEAWRENSTSIAFYNRPSMDGTRPGIYYANLADMTGVQKYVFTAITYHEGVPGHHFQLALAQELEGLSNFRKFGGGNAFVEGWALYAEKLAKEMGFYQDPMQDFGRLQDEIWRSVRLVTDTGIHAKKWTRQQAIDYFVKNTPLSPQDIETEVERYFVLPGQALGYKMGMTKILELRQRAENALGDTFDIRAFHDVIIGQGAMPLPILEQQVDRYIESNKI
ncbi:DUF885 domain-containing protein [Aliiglaciecola litoralis]|uniref:DUF885 domain-containing protein n=1 Tax=Aliiglaciecola litoralis TaxID=582857 RepID=A0ABP3WZS9_9ALTE